MVKKNIKIPYSKQKINQEDIKSVINVLKSDFLTQGPVVDNFERGISNKLNVKYSVAFNSATSALHIACKSIGIKKGDIVWTSPITFVASANAAAYCGASIDFIDIDKNTFNISIKYLKEKLKKSKTLGTLPKLIIPVHFGGSSCDMREIYSLSQIYKFKIIEDASHAMGGTYFNSLIGSCNYSDITVFSLHPVKIITSGEGGLATTKNIKLASKMKMLRTHGIVKNSQHMQNKPHGKWYYEQIDLGFNYRMSDIHAALGLSQLRSLDKFVKLRNAKANFYKDKLKNLPVTWQQIPNYNYSSYHLFVLRIDFEQVKKSKKYIFNKMLRLGIGVNVHYIPVHTQPYYANMRKYKNKFLESIKYYEEAITIPLYPHMSTVKQKKVLEALKFSIF
tara:strand:+ start:26535 stop:27710 length:1176 start_codon:yes stop_codon:yes gene_type:complete